MVADLTKKVSVKNHLWLEWKSLEHLGDGKIQLNSPHFYGPVLQDCEPLDATGMIRLDLTPHFMLILPKPYFVELSWSKLLSQDSQKVTFDVMTIQDQELGKLSILKNKDKLFINCTDQTTEAQEKGVFKAAFEIMAFNSLGEPYDLTK